MKIIHIGIHNSQNKNTGDTVLFDLVRKTFDHFVKDIEWKLFQLWEEVDNETVNEWNKNFDAIVLGGGGLMLKDQLGAEKSVSGWQWNINLNTLKAINIPIILFAVGYNKFRGQDDFEPIFYKHIKLLEEKSAFFGLRNTGSINAVKKFTKGSNIYRQYCPTTIINKLNGVKPLKKDLKKVAFNFAFDRASLRFNNIEKFFDYINLFIEKCKQDGYLIEIIAHKSLDLEALNYLKLFDNVIDLTESQTKEVFDYYNTCSMVFGMRGHAQMIPLGLNIPIFSLISHDKMKFLLEDINRETWGCEINDPNLYDILADFWQLFISDSNKINKEVKKITEEIFSETKNNFQIIKNILNA